MLLIVQAPSSRIKLSARQTKLSLRNLAAATEIEIVIVNALFTKRGIRIWDYFA